MLGRSGRAGLGGEHAGKSDFVFLLLSTRQSPTGSSRQRLHCFTGAWRFQTRYGTREHGMQTQEGSIHCALHGGRPGWSSL